jgi:pimeloyl-ACP methyl ester carboxylesterase
LARALAEALPALKVGMYRASRLSEAGERQQAIEQFYGLAQMALRTQRDGIACTGCVVSGHTTEISLCRIPAVPRPDKPVALFIPGLLASLPLAAVRALAFVDLFDIVLCELPGHGASGDVADVSIAAFGAEYAALIDTALRQATGVFVIGESLGGLVALALARSRPAQIRNVILIDTPFLLTRPELADWISQAWREAGRRPYVRRICREIMGFEPEDGRIERTMSHYDMVRNAPFNCAHIIGGDQQPSGIASVVTDADVAALRAANPAMLAPPRVGGTGHAVLLDNARGARAALETLIVKRVS